MEDLEQNLKTCFCAWILYEIREFSIGRNFGFNKTKFKEEWKRHSWSDGEYGWPLKCNSGSLLFWVPQDRRIGRSLFSGHSQNNFFFPCIGLPQLNRESSSVLPVYYIPRSKKFAWLIPHVIDHKNTIVIAPYIYWVLTTDLQSMYYSRLPRFRMKISVV